MTFTQRNRPRPSVVLKWRPVGHIYAVHCRTTPFVKIGFTSNSVKHRASAVQTHSPFETCLIWARPGSPRLEERMHKTFAERHVRGEWFDFSGVVAERMIHTAWIVLSDEEASA